MDQPTHERLLSFALDNAWRHAMSSPDRTYCVRQGHDSPPMIGKWRPDALLRYGPYDLIIEAVSSDEVDDPNLRAKLGAFLEHRSPDDEPASVRIVVEDGDVRRMSVLLSELDPDGRRTSIEAIRL